MLLPEQQPYSYRPQRRKDLIATSNWFHLDTDLIRASRNLIRHKADVPVLLSAMARKPDWLLTLSPLAMIAGISTKSIENSVLFHRPRIRR
jgi:hypothetical protein